MADLSTAKKTATVLVTLNMEHTLDAPGGAGRKIVLPVGNYEMESQTIRDEDKNPTGYRLVLWYLGGGPKKVYWMGEFENAQTRATWKRFFSAL